MCPVHPSFVQPSFIQPSFVSGRQGPGRGQRRVVAAQAGAGLADQAGVFPIGAESEGAVFQPGGPDRGAMQAELRSGLGRRIAGGDQAGGPCPDLVGIGRARDEAVFFVVGGRRAGQRVGTVGRGATVPAGLEQRTGQAGGVAPRPGIRQDTTGKAERRQPLRAVAGHAAFAAAEPQGDGDGAASLPNGKVGGELFLPVEGKGLWVVEHAGRVLGRVVVMLVFLP